MLGDWLRILLTLGLLVIVDVQAGWATAMSLFLIAARIEIQDYNEGRTFQEIADD